VAGGEAGLLEELPLRSGERSFPSLQYAGGDLPQRTCGPLALLSHEEDPTRAIADEHRRRPGVEHDLPSPGRGCPHRDGDRPAPEGDVRP